LRAPDLDRRGARRNDRGWRKLDADINRVVILSVPDIGVAST
jgi:hypothetical protein